MENGNTGFTSDLRLVSDVSPFTRATAMQCFFQKASVLLVFAVPGDKRPIRFHHLKEKTINSHM